jgi:hypothetical protein
MRLGESSHYTLLTAEVFTRALRCAIFSSTTKFRVTPKDGGDSGGWRSARRLRVVLVLGGLLVAGLVWRALQLAEVVRARSLPGVALPLALTLGAWELVRVVRTVRTVAVRRQRRARYRFPCMIPAMIKGADSVSTASVYDASVSGFGLATDAPIKPGSDIVIRTTVPDLGGNFNFVTLYAKVRRAVPRDADDGWSIGTETVRVEDDSRRRIVTFCHVVHPYRQLRGRRELSNVCDDQLEDPAERVRRLRAELRDAVAAVEHIVATHQAPKTGVGISQAFERCRVSEHGSRESTWH